MDTKPLLCLALLGGLMVVVGACSQGGSSGTGDEDAGAVVTEAGTGDDDLDMSSLEFTTSSFSPYIELTEDTTYARILFDFFPAGSDFDFTNASVAIPCLESAAVPEGVSASVSATDDTECDATTITFDEEGSELDEQGVIVRLGASGYQGLAADYSLAITSSGVYNTAGDSLLFAEDGTLEAFEELVVAAAEG